MHRVKEVKKVLRMSALKERVGKEIGSEVVWDEAKRECGGTRCLGEIKNVFTYIFFCKEII